MQLTTELLDPLVQYFTVINETIYFTGLVCEQLDRITSCDDCPLCKDFLCVRHTPELTLFCKTHYPELFI